MAKISLTSILSGFLSAAQLNDNFTKLVAEFQNKVLYRNNTSGEDNQMENSLDMNSNRILNLPEPVNANEAARLVDVQTMGSTSLPVQTGYAGKFIQTDGTIATWQIPDATEVSNTPAGAIAATTVQAAINELDTEKQPIDATLTSIAALGTAADKIAYTTGVDTWAETPLTAFARTILDDATADDVRNTLSVTAGNEINDDTITPASDADVTFNSAQNTLDRPILVTGAWTAAHDVIVDNTKRRFWFQNNSAYTATVKTSSGTGIPVGVGTSRLLMCDGTNVVDPLTDKDLPGVYSVDASVAANALTVTLNPCTLDFRSKTLGSGTVNRRRVSSAISVTVSSGSTLGTINAVASHIVVIALDNAGTVELAVVNLAGANDLSETGLISTTAEGGAGGADSASTIYSTTARTNVPYRVVGIIKSTQATAGTWATAPSLIQGAGGNAVTAMQSLGYGQTWQDVTGSRSAGVTYTNTTGRPIVFTVRASSTTTIASIVCTVAGLSSHVASSASAGFSMSTSALVPNGVTYSATLNNASLQSWSELR